MPEELLELEELELDELELEELTTPDEDELDEELDDTAPDEELELLDDELEPSVGVMPALLQPWATKAASTNRGVAKFFIASSQYWLPVQL